jgi:hypothetical protein
MEEPPRPVPTTRHTASAARLYAPVDPELWPYTATMPSPALVVIALKADALAHGRLFARESYYWIHGFRGTVHLDLAQLSFINSRLCAWIINVSQSALPARVEVLHANPRVREIMRGLGLDKVMDIKA